MLEIQFKKFPIFYSEKFILRRILEADCDAFFALRSNLKVMQFMDRPMPKDRQEILDLIKRIDTHFNQNEAITWAIAEKHSNTLIGTIGFWKIDKENHRTEIGYMLLPEFQNQGIMFEAMKLAIQYAFSKLKLHSIEANVNPENIASIKLLQKNQFVQEAYFKENYFYNGNFLDSAIYSLVAKK